jgi:hypothetical protein
VVDIPVCPADSAGVAASQSSHTSRSLSINGHTGNVTIYQIDGRSYVDLESLVCTGNGSMSFNGDQILLSFPSPDGDSMASHGKGSADLGRCHEKR